MACGIGAGALWGFAVLAPALVRDFSPVQIATVRYLVYGLLSAALIAPHWRVTTRILARQDWLAMFGLALAGNTLFYVLVAIAIQQGGVAMTALVLGFLPVIVTIVGSRDEGAVALRSLAPSLLLGTTGAACISWQTLATTSATPLDTRLGGLLAAIGALVSWSAFAVGNARYLARRPDVSGYDWNLLIGIVTGLQAVLLLPVALGADPGAHAADAWIMLAGVSVAVALASSIIGNALWNRMSRLLPLTMVGQMFLFETLFALLYGLLWERRWPHPLEIAAFVLVIASVLSCIGAHRRQTYRADPFDGAIA